MIRLRSLSAVVVLAGTAALGATIPSLVHAQVPAAQIRALNLARNTAVTDNGGLTVYRPAPCMFQTNTGGGDCLIQNNADGYTFQFLGGQPGWPEDNSQPTTETEIKIAPDGYRVDSVIYNGAPR